MPISCLAPEAVHSSDDFQYTIISGPTWWRHELASLSLRSGKDVVVAPPRTAAEATELFELAAFEARDLVLYNDLRFVPAVSELREVLLGGKGLLGPSSELRMSLTLAPPLSVQGCTLANCTKQHLCCVCGVNHPFRGNH